MAEQLRLVPVRDGPFYLLTAYGFFRSKSWLPSLLLPLAGMVVASTAIYIAIDATGDVPPSNWTMFYLFNGPYIVVPALAAIWVIVKNKKGRHAWHFGKRIGDRVGITITDLLHLDVDYVVQ